MKGQKFSSGFRQPAIHVPSGGSTKWTSPTPVSEELSSTSVPSQDHSEVESVPPQASSEQDSTSSENPPDR